MVHRTRVLRGVAQLGSASALGAEGRRFKSCHPDYQRQHCRAKRQQGRGHAVLSEHPHGHDAGTRVPTRRSRAGSACRHPTRILGHRHHRRSASCDSALHRRRRLRGPGYSCRYRRWRAPGRRRASRASGRCRTRSLQLPDNLRTRDPTPPPRPRHPGARDVKRVQLRTRSGRDRVHTPDLARRRETSPGPWRTLSELLCARSGRSPIRRLRSVRT